MFTFNKSSSNVSLYESSTRITTPSLCDRKNGTTYYAPLLTSRSEVIDGYKYSADTPTLCVRFGNTTYYGAKSRVLNVDIPEGTYTPSTFKSMMSNFMSSFYSGSSKKLKSSCTVSVNGKTRTLSAGDSIYYWAGPISGTYNYPNWQTFQFGTIPDSLNTYVSHSRQYALVLNGSSNGVVYYIVGYSQGTTGVNGDKYAGSQYANYPITVGGGGIKFA